MIVEEIYGMQGISSFTQYPSGEMKECRFDALREMKVQNQIYIPRFTSPDQRKKDSKAVSFYESGAVKSISLEERTVITTSLGDISAELITFYEDGSVNSVFPLNGQLGFGWEMEDEGALMEPMEFSFSFASFQAKIIGVRFFPNGAVKSMILWPGEQITIGTPMGTFGARIGFRLYESGCLESFEPALPVELMTPIGPVTAFDQHAVGMDADFNSIRFYEDGRIKSLATNSDIIIHVKETGERVQMYQHMRMDMTGDHMIKIPVVLTFTEDTVTIDNAADSRVFSIKEDAFLVLNDGYYQEKKCSPGSDCSGCGASCM